MSDYGHPLAFGSFLTPANRDPARVVQLALLSEQLGLDLVTFQDHPYQPGYLDTSTLLSFVAARTGRIHLAANVTNLPLRPPAVLARSIASLDLLSGGRIELGLGAGAFATAVEAMGGPRRTPGQAVAALAEAIEVIRQVWDAEARGAVRVDGEHYRVVGAKRGPAPAHPVGIWLGAYKPRMLALTGRVADGWLPSLGYLQPGDLARGNAVIDQAAEEAGRAPADIRRLLNLSGPLAVDDLAAYALDDGIGTFILAGDDPDDLRRFAAEVAPAVRAIVDAERGSPGPDLVDRPDEDGPERRAAAAITVAGPLAVVPTRDDGDRRSPVPVWDESTRPSGPVPAPNARYTAQEQANGQHLIDVHDHLRAELSQIDDLIGQVAAGSTGIGAARSQLNTMTMRQNNWTLGTYCESYCRLVATHHTLEDSSLFPQLRAADGRLAPVLDRLEQEHHAIHDLLEGVDRALVALVTGPDGIDGLRASVDRLSDALLSHLAYEERELVEPLARLGSA